MFIMLAWIQRGTKRTQEPEPVALLNASKEQQANVSSEEPVDVLLAAAKPL